MVATVVIRSKQRDPNPKHNPSARKETSTYEGFCSTSAALRFLIEVFLLGLGPLIYIYIYVYIYIYIYIYIYMPLRLLLVSVSPGTNGAGALGAGALPDTLASCSVAPAL